MPVPPTATRRWLTAATWPVGVGAHLVGLHVAHDADAPEESHALLPEPAPELLSYPQHLDGHEVQGYEDGCGPLFHRRYRTRVRDSTVSPEELIERIRCDPNRASPTRFARFQPTHGKRARLVVGDEYVVRMPGPWDGPVRVVDVAPRSFRLATLAGHLEAGQIEFRARRDGGLLVFEIESWARSSSRLVNLLYHRLRMAKEVQAHMWISFLERVVQLAGGRMTGGIEMETERIDAGCCDR